MLSAGAWIQDQYNYITFVMVDSTGAEVTGLADTFDIYISKNGGAFAAGVGQKSEIGNGWYHYIATPAEANTRGPISIYIAAGGGAIQQNLEYICGGRNANAIEYTYTVTDSVTSNPVPGIQVWVSTDAAGTRIVWNGVTDAFGVARDALENLPWLDAGTYYFWKHKVGYIDDQNPDVEVVS